MQQNNIPVWFTSDMHLGNRHMAEMRGFSSGDEMGWHLTETINEEVPKRGKLFILGDVIDSQHGLKWAKCIRCQNVELLLGNHDKLKLT